MAHDDYIAIETGGVPPLGQGTVSSSLAWLCVRSLDASGVVILPLGTDVAVPHSFSGLSRAEATFVAEVSRQVALAPGTVHLVPLAGAASAGVSARHVLVTALTTAAGYAAGCLCVVPRPGKGTPDAAASQTMVLMAGLIASHLGQERREAEIRVAARREARVQRMLHQVADAGSITDALTDMLKELCTYHDALIGRIWRMTSPGDLLQEISRFNSDDLDAQSYYRQPPAVPMIWGNSFTADALRRNQPRIIIYKDIKNPERYVLLQAAMDAGLQSQISYPIWVQEERFGVSLAFKTVRADLPGVVADIAALADTMRPALFRKVTEDRIRFLAHHDDLTQLANRPRFQDGLAQAIAAAARGEQGLGLLYLDLDNFKQVNDRRGHVVGDKLLAAVAHRLCGTIRAGDMVARMGGDEFAIIQAQGDQPQAAQQLASRVVETLSAPFDIEGQRLFIGCSVGVAVYPCSGDTPDLLLRNADTALYSAKDAGRNCFRVFEPGMNTRLRERVRIEGDMAEALATSQFTLAFQPLCDAATLGIVGFEALLRWTHPDRGPQQPDAFVQLAEASGLILPLGQWALEAACAEAARWDPAIRLAVNLSPLQFRQPDLPERVAAVLQRSGLAAHRLDLEVTEGLLLDDSGLVLDTMNSLRRQGVGMTLDDFGTAYASLSYLRRFPFDRIKIDKSFIDGITGDDETVAIVQTILALSVRLDLSVVAEGVETPEQLEVLRGLDCKFVQGYLTGRPMSGAEVTAHLARLAA